MLVVDDDSVNRLLLSRSLEREGHRFATAEDGRRALEILRAESFDVVLLDVVMPEIDGFEVLAQMQADSELRHDVVAVSDAVQDGCAERCLIERNRLARAIDPQLGLDVGHCTPWGREAARKALDKGRGRSGAPGLTPVAGSSPRARRRGD